MGLVLFSGDERAYVRYLKKDLDAETSVSCVFGGGFEIGRSDASQAVASPPKWDVQSAFYGRSSLRTIPELRGGAGAANPSAPTVIARAATSIRTGGSRATSRR